MIKAATFEKTPIVVEPTTKALITGLATVPEIGSGKYHCIKVGSEDDYTIIAIVGNRPAADQDAESAPDLVRFVLKTFEMYKICKKMPGQLLKGRGLLLKFAKKFRPSRISLPHKTYSIKNGPINAESEQSYIQIVSRDGSNETVELIFGRSDDQQTVDVRGQSLANANLVLETLQIHQTHGFAPSHIATADNWRWLMGMIIKLCLFWVFAIAAILLFTNAVSATLDSINQGRF